MKNNTKLLYNNLLDFEKETIHVLQKKIDIKSLPTIKKFYSKKINNRIKILVENRPNWSQIPTNFFSKLSSYKDAIYACLKHPDIINHHNKYYSTFNRSSNFNAYNIPNQLLKAILNREDQLRFRKKTFNNVFKDLVTFINDKEKKYARIIVPLDSLILKTKKINLEKDCRIKYLSLNERIKIINNCNILQNYYHFSGNI